MTANLAGPVAQADRAEVARRIPAWVALLGVVVLAVVGGAGGVVTYQWLHVRHLVAGLQDASAQVRARSCYRLGSCNSMVGARAVAALLAKEQDPGICEAAGYALQKMGATQAVDVFPGVISRLEDCPPLAKLIGYYASLGGDSVAEEIEALAHCGRTYRELGGGVGLLELDDVRGADHLLGYAAAEDVLVGEFAAHLLRRFCEPMMEMVGQPVDLSTPAEGGFSDSQLAALRDWWSRKDRTRELGDFNDWTRRDDPHWHQLKRLKHAREKANRFLGLTD